MLTDEQLMEQLQQGQTDALDALYSRYARKLYAFCSSSVRSSGQDPEDLVQDVFLRVIKGAHTFSPRKASFHTWVYRIARNRCIDVSRRGQLINWMPIGRKTEHDDAEGLAPEDVAAHQDEDADGAIIRASIMEAIRDCISELRSQAEKQAILLYYLGGKVYREIGGILGESTSMARNRVKSAQDRVKRCLERKGIDSL